MQAFFVYLLKVIVYSGILFGYYHIALRNKRFHYYNRFYLLMNVALSLTLPFLQLHIWQWKSSNPQVIILANTIVTSKAEPETSGYSLSLSFSDFVLFTYDFIAVCLLLSFVFGLLKIIRLKKQYPSEKIGDVLFINTDLQQAPFSFFTNLFWKNSIDITDETGQRIFRHELTHIEQKHSTDKLFMQVITLLFWLNPFYWLIQKELSLIHEFIADEKAIDNKDAEAFALMLLQSQFGRNSFLPIQSFHYSPIKRRLLMLTSSSKTSHSYARRILALPLLSLSILLFAFTLYKDHQPGNRLDISAPFTLLVDAGHGGTVDGATGINDVVEKGFNLSIAKKVAELAPQYGITVKMTRTEDATLSQEERLTIIKKEQPDAFISIHVNRTDEKQTSKEAFQVYITKNNTGASYSQSRLLGSSLIQSVKTSFPVDADLMQSEHGIYVLDQNPYPAIVLECGYMNNAKSLQMLNTDAGIENIAKDILEGVAAYANNRQSATVTISSSDTTGKQPLYILDGKEISAEEMKKLDANTIASINVLKDKEAIEKYGKKGENGVVLITLKSRSTKEQLSSDSVTTQMIIKNSSPNSVKGQLIYVDGKLVTEEEFQKLDAGQIQTISVLKDNYAVEKYGEKGRKGVIDIVTKKGELTRPEPDSAKTDAGKNGDAKESYGMVFTTSQESPSFPGGTEAWVKYLQRNLRSDIPVENKAPKGTYTVTISFEVDAEGNISHLKATNDPGFGTAAEAIRVIQRGPKWIPAKQNGRIVTAIAKQEITFVVA